MRGAERSWTVTAVAAGLLLLAGLGFLAFVVGRSSIDPSSTDSARGVLASEPIPTATTTLALPTPKVCGLDEVNLAAQSVVRLETIRALGSGFLLPDGTLVTNAHVVGTVAFLDVQYADGSLDRAEVVGVSDLLDVATLRPSRPARAAGLSWGDSASLRGAQSVVAIGFPLGLDGPPILTKGSVSRLVTLDGEQYVQTDSAINPGNSGGPLIDECGKVVGIVTLGIRNAEGLGFAQAASAVRPEIESLIARPRVAAPARPTATPTPLPTTPPRPRTTGDQVAPLLETWHSDFLDYVEQLASTGNDVLDHKAYSQGQQKMGRLRDSLTAYANTISGAQYKWPGYPAICRSARDDMTAAFRSMATAADWNATMFAQWPNNAQTYLNNSKSAGDGALARADTALNKILPCASA